MYTIYVKCKTGELEKYHGQDKETACKTARAYAEQDDVERVVVCSVFDKTLFYQADDRTSAGRPKVIREKLKKNYYLADDEYIDSIYGSEHPICIDMAEIKRLAREWGMTTAELRQQMHESSAEEIAEYGIYNG